MACKTRCNDGWSGQTQDVSESRLKVQGGQAGPVPNGSTQSFPSFLLRSCFAEGEGLLAF